MQLEKIGNALGLNQFRIYARYLRVEAIEYKISIVSFQIDERQNENITGSIHIYMYTNIIWTGWMIVNLNSDTWEIEEIKLIHLDSN